jgi:hypothetical protein
MKVATFTVRATEKQSLRWKRAAEHEGFASVGGWLAEAADRYLDAVIRAGKPLPLAWRRGRFRVRFLDGSEGEVKGLISQPFGVYWGTEEGPERGRREWHTLVSIPAARQLATLKTAAHCRSLASELARTWVRWGGAATPCPG